MKELVEYIVKQIVSVPDSVEVTEDVSGSVVNLSLKVADEDMGIVIGKKGQTIRSIRTLLIVRAMNDGVRVNLTLVDVRPQSEVKGDGEDSLQLTADSKQPASDRVEEMERSEELGKTQDGSENSKLAPEAVENIEITKIQPEEGASEEKA